MADTIDNLTLWVICISESKHDVVQKAGITNHPVDALLHLDTRARGSTDFGDESPEMVVKVIG